MHASQRTDHKTLGWALGLALALLLKAAVPLLAVAAADAQGKALFEVCSAYGVRTVAPDVAPTAPHPADEAAAHGGEPCVLASLLLLGGGTPPLFEFVPVAAAPTAVSAAAMAGPHDASARWLTGLKHAPPARA